MSSCRALTNLSQVLSRTSHDGEKMACSLSPTSFSIRNTTLIILFKDLKNYFKVSNKSNYKDICCEGAGIKASLPPPLSEEARLESCRKFILPPSPAFLMREQRPTWQTKD